MEMLWTSDVCISCSFAMAVQNEHSRSRDAVNLSKRLIRQTRPAANTGTGKARTMQDWSQLEFPAAGYLAQEAICSTKIERSGPEALSVKISGVPLPFNGC
jgi:hypothetical protein